MQGLASTEAPAQKPNKLLIADIFLKISGGLTAWCESLRDRDAAPPVLPKRPADVSDGKKSESKNWKWN